MYRRFAATLLVATAIFLLSHCSHDSTTGPELLPIGEPIQLSPGQSAAVGPEELFVTLESVNFDERCSGADTCLWPGLAEISIRLRNSAGKQAKLDLVISGDSLLLDPPARRGSAFGY